MDYKFTFQDGSEAYLAHHGVKGMKWGVWNEETRAKMQGGTSREAKKYMKGYDKYQKAKTKAEIAADRYVSNPTAGRKRAFQKAAGKEARLNSQAYKDASKYGTRSWLLGGAPGYAVYTSASKKQHQRLDLASAHMNETMATRLDESIARTKRVTGQKAVESVLSASASYKSNANKYYEKAAGYEREAAMKEHQKGQKALANAQRMRASGNEQGAHGYDTLHAGRTIRRDEHLRRANNIRKVKSANVDWEKVV